MMHPQSGRSKLKPIIATFVIALILSIIPLSEDLRFFRPDWVALCLIYWCIFLPNRIGVFSGWAVGLVTDEITGSLLGQHALAFSVIAFISIQLQHRTRHYPAWQQALNVLTLLILHRLLMHWILGITGFPPNTLLYMLPAIIGALIWPLFANVMTNVRQRYSIR
ncbi:MAG: rod shape-determining protein MreD [Methylococcales bacterium]|jgi:rod shape-determining protein MreD|nr:rod shape-determining protein MreD [Methylococcales bacterium]MBT7442644.1 rod shape-determining protein MreD [Methylococcales bacterium]